MAWLAMAGFGRQRCVEVRGDSVPSKPVAMASKPVASAGFVPTPAPPGRLGLTLVSSPFGPVLVKPGKLSGAVCIGWVLVAIDDDDVRGLSSPEAASLLRQREERERTLLWDMDTAADSLVGIRSLDVPPGRLGIEFVTDDPGPRIVGVEPMSPLVGSTRSPGAPLIGQHILEIDDIDVTGNSGQEVGALLVERAGRQRRLKLYGTSHAHGQMADLSQIIVVR